jgi:hypothetical protein
MSACGLVLWPLPQRTAAAPGTEHLPKVLDDTLRLPQLLPGLPLLSLASSSSLTLSPQLLTTPLLVATELPLLPLPLLLTSSVMDHLLPQARVHVRIYLFTCLAP